MPALAASFALVLGSAEPLAAQRATPLVFRDVTVINVTNGRHLAH